MGSSATLVIIILAIHCNFISCNNFVTNLNDTLTSGVDLPSFYLYTKSNQHTPVSLNDPESIRRSGFNASLHTKILIHGWYSNYTTPRIVEIREAYLSQNDYNIICVDWYKEDYSFYFYWVRSVTEFVGVEIASFVDYMNLNFKLDLSKLVLIGYSVGAHIAGHCGKNVKNGRIGAIVGLDPISLLFAYEDSSNRLNATDAQYVAIYQTYVYYGYYYQLGHAGFYPNWGRTQTGCGIDWNGFCSHCRSVNIFSEAVKKYNSFPVYRCSSEDAIRRKSNCSIQEPLATIGDPMEVTRVYGTFYFATPNHEIFQCH